jgi:Neuraminidase (sialidase)
VIVYSDDGGATWNQLSNANAHRASAVAGQWSEITNVAATPVYPGAAYRAGILIARDDASTGNFTDSRCQVVVTIHNQNGTSPPY